MTRANMVAAAAAWMAMACGATPAFAQADPNKVLRVAFPIAETGFDPPPREQPISTRIRSIASFSIRCLPIQLPGAALYGRARIPRPACRKSPRTGRPGRSRSSRESISRTIRRSRARSGSSRPPTTCIRGSDCSIRRSFRPRCRPSTRRSSAWRRRSPPAKKTGKFDYDAPLEGMQAIDRYTLRIKLVRARITTWRRRSRRSPPGPWRGKSSRPIAISPAIG